MSNLPAIVSVSSSSLDAFLAAFKKFAASERKRLASDKAFLETLEISDVQQVVSSIIDSVTEAAAAELNTLLAKSPGV